jgi:hypothetical protein
MHHRRSRYAALGVILLVLLFAGTGRAQTEEEELVGVPVYPGAQLDEAMTDHLEEVMLEEGAAYCTADGPLKVEEFYRNEGFSAAGAGARGRVVFRREDIQVVIQGPPRKDQATGRRREDTLILIIREE